jgi:hypothetical protein
MNRLSHRGWHAIHLVSYIVFWLATFHRAFAGTNRSRPLYQ